MPVSKKKPTTLTSEGSTQESSSPVLPEQEDFRQVFRHHPVCCVLIELSEVDLREEYSVNHRIQRGDFDTSMNERAGGKTLVS